MKTWHPVEDFNDWLLAHPWAVLPIAALLGTSIATIILWIAT